MTDFTAVTSGTNDWGSAATWTADSGFPNSASDTATLGYDPTGFGYTVSISTGETFTVGTLTMTGNGTTFATTALLINGGSLDVTGDIVNNSGLDPGGAATFINLENSGELEVDSGVSSANVTLSLSGADNVLAIGADVTGAVTAFGSTIEGFSIHGISTPGDVLVLENAKFDGTFSHYTVTTKLGVVTVKDQGTTIASGLELGANAGGQKYVATDYVIGGTEYVAVIVACFQAGTHLLTERGEVAVEDLREGDMMVTFSGRGETLKPVTWIGQRRIDLASHDNPEIARPVRIRAGAFGEAVPHRDLLLSPDHAVYVDGVLIPAKHLINGTTITQDASIEEAHYFHIEVDEHDVLLAEGLTVESYLDTGNRDVFANVAPISAPGFADALSA